MTVHPDYITQHNGTLKRINPPVIAYDQPYWGVEGRSTIEDQCWNCHGFTNDQGVTKAEVLLKWCVAPFILEIGCAPGAFLKLAREAGYDCTGIEPCAEHIPFIEQHSGAHIINGMFPKVALLSGYTSLVAADVIEHCHDPEAFVTEAMALLAPGGRLILMLPLLPNARTQDFCPEHVTLFSEEHIREWLNPLAIELWMPGHTVVVVEKEGVQ